MSQPGLESSAALRQARAWEFWPSWAFYTPVGVWIAWLAVRHGVAALAAANPGLPDGGLVGESKFDILERLPARWTIPAVRISGGTPGQRAIWARSAIEAREWSYPVIAKPDVGQRGVGVRRLEDPAALGEYLHRHAWDVVIQPWHPGPFEAGVFYWRVPGEPVGRIFSITDKVFPFVVGNGESTLAELVRTHPRFRRQEAMFLRRHEACRNIVVPRGRAVRLGDVGNHAQGTMFRDGAHLWTPALERRIDEIARTVPGFFVGRFDVRYSSVHAFREGNELAIVELNGVSAESTNIYDPSRSLIDAYRTLFKQWSLVYQIGARNLRLGVAAASAGRLLRLSCAHLCDRREFPVSS